MATTVTRAASRGHADLGWLDTNHSFSFGQYYNPDRVNFGVLRVFNDDKVIGGKGFGTHPHDNMEIISIPLGGELVHEDSMGHTEALRPGDVQVMSAGTGITHSEYNGSKDDPLTFLQIWIIPNRRNVEPRYDQGHFIDAANTIDTIVGPKGGAQPLWMHQDAWLSIVRLDAGTEATYTTKREGNGVFVFVVDGRADIAEETLFSRDSIEITESPSVVISAQESLRAIVIDVPMK